MRTFKEYIIEKTNKKEFEEALKNDNILAGCEFEFYISNTNFENRELRDNLERLLQDANEEVDDFNRRIEQYNDALSELYRDEENLKKEIDDLDGEIMEIESNISSIEDEISDMENKISELGDEQRELSGPEYDDISKEIKGLKSDLKDKQKELNNLNDMLDKRKRILGDLSDKQEDFDNNVTQDNLMDEYDPIPNSNTMNSYFELEYDYNGTTRSRFDQNCYDWFEHGEVPYPEIDIDYIVSGSDGGEPTEDDIVDLGFPVKFTKDWDVRPDGSLGDGGIEIITPPLKLSELIKTIEKVFDWIDDVGYTNNDCGFHVHMSINNGKELDPLKLILFADEGLIYKKFSSRIGNSYAKSIKVGHVEKITPFGPEDVIKVAKDSKLLNGLNMDKYLGINLVDLQKNHVEFRYMGGDEYHKKFKDVREVIINYAHWMSIAGDPDYKKKEYITKVTRLSNYFNYIYLDKVIDNFTGQVVFYKENIKNNGWKNIKGTTINLKEVDKIANKIIKPFTDSIKTLPEPKNSRDTELDNLMEKAIKISDIQYKKLVDKVESM